MPILQTMRGRIVDLRRHTNVHLYWRGWIGPTERYELWLRDPAGREHQFTIHTRTLPARLDMRSPCARTPSRYAASSTGRPG